MFMFLPLISASLFLISEFNLVSSDFLETISLFRPLKSSSKDFIFILKLFTVALFILY